MAGVDGKNLERRNLMNEPSALLNEALKAKNNYQTERAMSLLNFLVAQEPKNALAWLTLADMVKSPNEKLDCLSHVLAIDPGNQAARQRFADLLTLKVKKIYAGRKQIFKLKLMNWRIQKAHKDKSPDKLLAIQAYVLHIENSII